MINVYITNAKTDMPEDPQVLVIKSDVHEKKFIIPLKEAEDLKRILNDIL